MPIQPIPETKGLFARFFEGVEAGRIDLQSCNSCGHVWHYPRPVCPSCGARDIAWMPSSGRGTIHSFTIVHHPPKAAFKADVPYVVAFVDLDEGARLTTRLVGEDAQGAAIGDRVEVVFGKTDQGTTTVPAFRRTPS